MKIIPLRFFAAPDEYSSTSSKLKPQWRLSRTPNALVLTHKDGRRLHFGHAVGQHIRLSKILDADRRFIKTLATYQYDRKGHLLSVRAESGRNFDYQYSKQGG